ncbi:MAG: hypothetical protein WC662_04515 [Candidatus Paceibacterota bacterium]|jgi:hypothetical protein
MENQKVFTEEDNTAIYLACESLRVALFFFNGTFIMGRQTESDTASAMNTKLHKGSLINSLINQGNWNELFKNEDWLNFLESSQNFVFEKRREGRNLVKDLGTIQKFFPEETSRYIIPGISMLE